MGPRNKRKVRLLCKCTFEQGGTPNTINTVFIKGKWYDGEIEGYFSDVEPKGESGFGMGFGYRIYFYIGYMIDENGEEVKIDQTTMQIIFENDMIKIRDGVIDELLSE